MAKRQTFFQAFSWIAILTLISKLLGFVREAIIASLFGASLMADMIYVALIIPTIAFTVIGTAIQGQLLPAYIASSGRRVFQQYSFLFITISFGLLTAILLLIQPIVMVIAPGFNSQESLVTSWLSVIIIPVLIFMTLNSLTQVIFHANDHFTPPAVGPVVNNVVTILIIVMFYSTFHIYSVALGILVGSIGQFLYQFSIVKEKSLLWPSFKNVHFKSQLKKLKPIFPIIIAALALQLNLLVDRVVASFLDEGGIAALNYSYRLLWIPLSILLMPITTIFYPKMTRALKLNNLNYYRELIANGFNVILLIALPIMLVMLLESDSIIKIVYERGAFSVEATVRTSGALLFYTVGLLFFATREYFVHHFYAHERYRNVMYGSLIGVTINILLSVILAQYIGINGIAVATSFSMFVQTIYYYYFIRKDYFILNLSIIAKAVFSITLIGLVIQLLRPLINDWQYISFLITTLITFGFYFLLLQKEVTRMLEDMKGT
ncbi:murein biosynthesis integral membrane protein MurJ [Aquisalibacillus elongatus]|uniref:Probable lipid II flippase MurJ n=1 Tax=Aquisalibacillus elongatus TaxID=485577 RepID=A0A3N5C411_9BACI|nr:murein biosynthesis integral membrane protein MurJ [Aquisalibacillus elongatus]RPF54192.1 putative peptidoglycan lipid II flippase [Aquisalibacillus elongatus]